MELLKAALPLLSSIWKGLKDLFLGLFLIKVGKQKQELEQIKEEEKVTDEHKQMADNLRSKSRKSRLGILLSPPDDK